jgi:hypothetical protein
MALFDSYSTGFAAVAPVHAARSEGQTFTPSVAYTITSVQLLLASDTADDEVLTVGIYATGDDDLPTGSALCFGTINANTLTSGAGSWKEIDFGAGADLTPGLVYAIGCSCPGDTGAGVNDVEWWVDTDDGAYAGGNRIYDNIPGGDWDGAVADDDFMFKCYGTRIGGGVPDDRQYTKKLVTIGNNEVWYESAADTMAVLTAATGEVDTTKVLSATEAFQKVFIANQTNLKVADFANTKLTVVALTTVPTRGDVLTQVTSTATMVVDFVNTAKTEIYGYTTSGTFDTASNVDGGDMAPARTPSAVAEASTTPHWYDWTAYAGGASGTITASAYLVCLYRGRLVLSGNPNYPHQWYMSKIGDPFNWVYSSTNPLSAVAGNNTDAGEVGDIVRALIPFGDDFLVFGCANSVHILDGDAVSGGSIDEVSDDTGMFSWNSWCKDEDGNLYFYGNHGIYLMMGGRSKPTNISKSIIPNLALDWAVNPATHRVVLSYDAANRGIIIVRTTLADGTCSGYFYSLDTQGFYPISFANTGDGIYCSFDYNADDPSYRKLLFGCYDGYIRNFLSTNKNDDYGASSTAVISSYFSMIEPLSVDSDREGKLTSLTVEMVGGFEYRLTHAALTIAHTKGDILTQATSAATMIVDFTDSTKTHTFGHTVTNTWDTTNAVTSDGDGSGFTPSAVGSGSFVNSDGCSYEYHKADDAETVLEYLRDSAVAIESGTLSGTGRKSRIRKKIRAAWLALKFYNSSASETFGINKVFGEVKEVGKIK